MLYLKLDLCDQKQCQVSLFIYLSGFVYSSEKWTSDIAIPDLVLVGFLIKPDQYIPIMEYTSCLAELKLY